MDPSKETMGIMQNRGAILINDHFVYTSGKHGSAYVNKDAVYPQTRAIATICNFFSVHFFVQEIEIEVVVGPAMGGIILSQWTARSLSRTIQGNVFAVYADKTPDGGFIIKRGYEKLIPGKKVLVVEDILTTGNSAKKVVEEVRRLGGEVVALAAICNRGGLTAEDIGVPELYSLTEVPLESWEAEECPLCEKGVPINIDVGKGREFLEKRNS